MQKFKTVIEKVIINRDEVSWYSLLKKKDIDMHNNNYNALVFACENGYIDIVELLLKDGRTNPAYDYNYSIFQASRYGEVEVVKLLLKDKRVDPADSGNSSIILANKNNYDEVVLLLLNDNRVQCSLKNENIELYNKLIKKHLKNKISCF